MDRADPLSALQKRRAALQERRQNDRRASPRRAEKGLSLRPVARYSLYLASTFIAFQGFILIAYFTGAKFLFSENGPVEWFQFSLLLACGGCLEGGARRSRPQRHPFRFAMILFLIAAVREMDANFDRYLFDGAWQLAAAILIFCGGLLCWYRGRQIREQFQPNLISRSGGLLLAGALTAFVFAPLLGQQRFWHLALGERYVRMPGRIIEESSELLGYLFLFFGCLETLLSSPPDSKNASPF